MAFALMEILCQLSEMSDIFKDSQTGFPYPKAYDTDVGTGGHRWHAPHLSQLLGKVPLCSLKICQFLLMRVPLNTCAPPLFKYFLRPWHMIP